MVWSKEKIAEYHREYYEKNKEKRAEQMREYRRKNKEKILEYKRKNKEKILDYYREYFKTEKGKQALAKNTNKRRRNLGFELLFDKPQEWNCDIDYHHISNGFVVPLPRFIHRQYLGKQHRQRIKPVVEMLYNMSYVIDRG